MDKKIISQKTLMPRLIPAAQQQPQVLRQLLVTNMQIYQFANKAVPAPVDLFLMSDEQNPGHITVNSTVAQVTAVVQKLITSKGNVRYVSPASQGGDDTNGTGTEGNPWATLPFALSQITDASPTNPYKIVLAPGSYAETDLAIKLNITYDFQNSQFTVTNPVTIDASETGLSGVVTFQNISNLVLSGGTNLDFAGLNIPFAVLNFDKLVIGASTLWTILGNPTGATIVIIEQLLGFANEANFDMSDCYGGIGNGAIGDLTIRNTTGAGHVFTAANLQVLGNYYSEVTGAGDLIGVFVAVRVQGTTTFKTTSTGQNQEYSLGSRFASAPVLDGALSFWNPDLISALPTCINGATVATNLVLSTIANGILANYTGVNYTATDDTVAGQFPGIDAALGGIITSIALETAYQGGSRILVETGVPVGFDTAAGSLQDAVVNEGSNVSGGTDDINGFVFTSDVDGLISFLEYYAPNFTLPGTRQVGILNVDTQEILAVATISTSDPQVGQFYRKAIPPVRIVAGQGYICEALVPAGENYSGGAVTPDVDINVHLTLSQVVYEPSQTGIVYPSQFHPVINAPTGNGSFAFTPISTVAEIDDEKANFHTGFKGFQKQQIITGDQIVNGSHVGLVNVGSNSGDSSLILAPNLDIQIDASFLMLTQESGFSFSIIAQNGVTLNGQPGIVEINLNAYYPRKVAAFVQRVSQNDYIVAFMTSAQIGSFFQIANNLSEIAGSPQLSRGSLGLSAGLLIINQGTDYTISNPAPALTYVQFTTADQNLLLAPTQQAGGVLNGDSYLIYADAVSNDFFLKDSLGQPVSAYGQDVKIKAGEIWKITPVGFTLSPVTGLFADKISAKTILISNDLTLDNSMSELTIIIDPNA